MRHEGDMYIYMEPDLTTLERKYCIMQEFLDKIGAALDALNASTLWSYIKSVVAKLKELLKLEGEEEASDLVDIIFGDK